MTAPRPGSYDATVYRTPAPPPPPAFQRGLPNQRAANLRPHPARAPQEWLTVAEVAADLRVSKMTVYRLIHLGDIASSRVGRSFRIRPRAVDEYLACSSADTSKEV